ncbi:MAG: MarR family transcriptional regulator [Bacteroidales bacterium]|nr:MarR family transcriptional regulator [Bacteroidales bacterium]
MYDQLKLENQLCFRLYSASRLVTQAYRPLLEPLGLTYPQYLVLLVLWEHKKQTVGEIGEKLLLESNTLTPLLQRMEREELIVRTKGVSDTRQTVIELTPKGKHLERKAKDIPTCLTANWMCDNLTIDNLISCAATLDNIIALLKK